jgi:MFS transporter, SP family, general alpha glucoside:H+ symporter
MGVEFKTPDAAVDVEKPDMLLHEPTKATQAQHATDLEHAMTFWEGLKLYPTSVLWSIFFSLGIIMTAFDPQLLGNLYATPAFQQDFGYLFQGSYIISAPWQTGLGMGSPIGQVVGALAAGYPMEWFGRKKVLSRFFSISNYC